MKLAVVIIRGTGLVIIRGMGLVIIRCTGHLLGVVWAGPCIYVAINIHTVPYANTYIHVCVRK